MATARPRAQRSLRGLIPAITMTACETIEGKEAENLCQLEKWNKLAPHLRQHGQGAFAYATLQEGLEYFIDDGGYIAYASIKHPVFAPRGKKIVLGDPICAASDFRRVVEQFLQRNQKAVFVPVSEACGAVLRDLGFKVDGVGYEPEIDIQSYNTQGNWKDLDLIKRARNEAKGSCINNFRRSGAMQTNA